MLTYLLTIGLIMVALLIYVVVQQRYKLFAHEHPELGPFRVEGKGCGSGACSGDGSCGGSGDCDSH